MKRFKQLIQIAAILFFGLLCSKIGFDKGVATGYKNGKENAFQKMENAIQYEILTPESVSAIDSLYFLQHGNKQ